MKDSDFKKLEKEFEALLLLQAKLELRIKSIKKKFDDNKSTISIDPAIA